jgi:hypothetical protein
MRVLEQFPSNKFRLAAGLVLVAAVGMAQTQPSPGWRRTDDPAPVPSQSTPSQSAPSQSADSPDPSTPVASPDLDQNSVPPGPPPATPPPNFGVPAHLTIPAGKFINVRVDQPLSTDRNHQGDFFSATLIDPIVVDGFVVVQRGQHVAGQVTEADKGGRVSGVARLGLQLTELTTVDGQQLPIHTQFISRNAPSTVGRDAGVIAGSTAVGAAVGAAAAWGRGAAIGAGAGAVLGIAGVLLSRGAPAVVVPETPLTFRVEQAVDVNTERSPQSFQPVNPNDYQSQPQLRTGPYGPAPAPGGAYGYPYASPYGSPYGSAYGYPAPYAYAYPYPYAAYPYPYYPYYWGPGLGVFIGGPYYRGGFYGGFYGRGGFRR